MKNILFVASECVPFIKTGGLADVVGSLPKYFPKEYFDVRVVIPKYAGIKEQFRNQMQYVTNFYMDLNWRQQYVGIFEMEYEGIKFYFIDNEEHFIHCHDWQTGLVPVYLHERFQADEFYRGIKTVMTIHNLKFQGIWDRKTIQSITGLSDYYFTPDKLEFKHDASYLKGGLVYADAITTVSNTCVQEQTICAVL